MDKGTEIHAHQPEVGTSLGHLAVLQQINPLGCVIVDVVTSHTPSDIWVSCQS